MSPPFASPTGEFTCGEWTVQPELDRIARGGESVHLQPRVMDLLVELARRAGRVVPKRQLLDVVWPEGVVSDAVLNRSMFELRRALGDSSANPRFVETIPKRGYRLVASIGWGDEVRAAPPEDHGPAGFDAPLQFLGPDVRGYLVCGSTEAALTPGAHLVGRGQEAKLVIRHPQVSRCHARVWVNDEGVFIEDLGSRNGTVVRGQRVEGRVRLSDGDRIDLGCVELVYRDAGDRSTRV